MSPGLHAGDHDAQYIKEDIKTWDARYLEALLTVTVSPC